MFSISNMLVFLVGIHRHKAGFYPTWTLGRFERIWISEVSLLLQRMTKKNHWPVHTVLSCGDWVCWLVIFVVVSWVWIVLSSYPVRLHCQMETLFYLKDILTWFVSSFLPVSLHSWIVRSLFCIWYFLYA